MKIFSENRKTLTLRKTVMKTLKTILFISGLLLFSLSNYAQETEKREIDNFHSVSIIGKIRCELYKAETPGLEVVLKGVEFENVITENDNGELSLRLKTSTPKDAEVKIKLFYTQLDEMSVQAQSLIVSPEVIKAEKIFFSSKSGGKMELKLNLSSLEAEIKQGGILVFYGSVEKQKVSVSTGGTYSAYELESQDAHVKANSGGKAKVSASRIIDATANSKAFIGYQGNPVSTYIKTNLGGEIAHHQEGEE